MAKKVITFGLSKSEIDKAIKELDKYKRSFERKVDLFRQKVAEEIKRQSQMGFNASGINDVVHSGTRPAKVTVDVSHNGNVSIVFTDGEDAVWCEFGAGIYHNTPVGDSPNPYGKELQLTIGSFGEGKGGQRVWGYYEDPDDKNSLVLTHGTPATMPMYNAVQSVVPRIVEIAKEVFK